ncbi:MAG TPA: sugar phosphate isomerase/epimerase family protein [Armatimonadota bacterium]|jgi:sugar phosphate isomerase/epimerase
MFRCVSLGAIGVGVPYEEGLALAPQGHFQGIEVGIDDMARRIEETSAEAVKEQLQQAGLRPGGWGLPTNWRGDEAAFQEDLKKLPRLGKAAQQLDCLRASTWVLSFSDTLPFQEHFSMLETRFRAIGEILKDYGVSVGLEFLGPKTMWGAHKYEFIHTLGGMLELADAIGTGNIGLLLDCWHWYTSGGTVEELHALRPEQVVYVHVNDAPAGVPLEEHVDNVRGLPGETGVINITGFLKALQAIGYEGPVTPEPFSSRLKGLSPEDAVRLTGDSLMKVWTAAGLS